MEKVKILLLTLMVALSVNLRAQKPEVLYSGSYYDDVNKVHWKYNAYNNNEGEITGVEVPAGQATPSSLKIPEVLGDSELPMEFTVTQIGKSAFKGSKFSSISFPSTVKILGDSAFYGASLEKITLQAGFSKVGKYAFANCIRLHTVESPSGFYPLSIGLFYGCKSLTSIKLSNFIKGIPPYAFAYSGLTSIELRGNSLTSQVAFYAFAGCWKLTTVKMQGYNRILHHAFYDCSALTSFEFPETLSEIGPYAFAESGLSAVDLSATYAKIGNAAFRYCRALKSVKLPKQLDEIADSTFSSCTSLSIVESPDWSFYRIGTFAFYDCLSLRSIELPANLSKIGNFSFSGCHSLATVKFPERLSEIGKSAFLGCSALRSIELPANLSKISPATFAFCESLASVKFPERLSEIGNDAFSPCNALRSIELPANLSKIGKEAFASCRSLRSVKWPTNSCQIEKRAFSQCFALGPDLTLENLVVEDSAFYNVESFTGTLKLRNCKFVGKGQFIGGTFFQCAKFRYLDADVFSLKQLKREQFEAALSKYYKNYTMTLKNGSVIAEMESIPDSFLTNMNFLRGKISFSPQLKGIGNYAFYNCGLAANAADIPSSAKIGDGVFRLAPNFTGDVVIPEAFGLRPYQDEWSGKLPFTISGITSIDLGNIENFFSAYDRRNEDLSERPLWADETYDQRSPNLLWIDSRKCIRVRGLRSQSIYRFGRNGSGRTTYNNFIGLDPNTLVYLPPLSVFQQSMMPGANVSFEDRFNTDEYDDETGGNGSNFIMDEKCKQFFVKEGLSYRVPFAFTAQTARYTRTFKATTGKAVSTLYLPYPTDLPAGMCAYTFVKRGVNTDGEKTFVFRKVPQGTRLEANTPYLVQITDGQPHKLPVMRNVEVPASPKENAAGLPGIETSSWKFCGTTEKLDNAAAYAKNAYYLSGDKWWAVRYGVENDYIAPFRCYFSAPKGAAPTRNFFLVLEDDDNSSVTGVKQLEGETEQDIYSGKYPFYSIDGKLMGKDYNKLERGQIYIVNGKKFYKI